MTQSALKQNTDGRDFDGLWRRAREILRAELGERPFSIHIAPLKPISADVQRCTIGCGDDGKRDTVAERYGIRIANLLAQLSGIERAVDFVSEPSGYEAIVSAPSEDEVSSLDLRLALLEAKAARLARERPGFAVGGDVLLMIAARIPKDGSVLEAALLRLAASSATEGQAITMASAQTWLADMMRAHNPRVSVERIKRYITQRYHLKPDDLESASRRSEIVRPRQLAFYVARKMTGKSFPDLGRHFRRDHSTILHGYEKIVALKETNPEIAAELDAIIRALRD